MSNRSRIVRLVSVDKRYRANIYPSVPVKDESINAYLTGQHIDPKKPETRNNLTLLEMTGRSTISEDKLNRFPHILFVETIENGKPKQIVYPLKHGDKCNLSQDATGKYLFPRDKAMFDYWQHQPVIVSKKEDVIPGETMFYIEDREAEAAKRVSIEDLIFEAQTLVRSSNIGKYNDIALLLNYNIKGFNINVSVLTELQIKDKLIEACKNYPDVVINCFAKGVEKDLFILKLIDKGIITTINGSYYDGKMFVGQSLDEIKSFIEKPSNQEYLNKWGRLLENY